MVFSLQAMSGIFLLTLTAILSIVYFFRQPRAIAIRPREARELIHTTATTVIDVRTDDEWATGHYPHAFHIPRSDLQAALPKHIADRSTPLLIYCHSGRRAAQAAAVANSLGYATVYYLVDGSYEDLEEHLRLQ
jgi:rhodanese-related sulfurtransferase